MIVAGPEGSLPQVVTTNPLVIELPPSMVQQYKGSNNGGHVSDPIGEGIPVVDTKLKASDSPNGYKKSTDKVTEKESVDMYKGDTHRGDNNLDRPKTYMSAPYSSKLPNCLDKNTDKESKDIFRGDNGQKSLEKTLKDSIEGPMNKSSDLNKIKIKGGENVEKIVAAMKNAQNEMKANHTTVSHH